MSEQPPPSRASSRRAYLDVPYGEKDEAKALGARWDPAAKRWYDPRPPSTGLDRWAARPDVPDLLPGEDRTFGDGLFVDLVPRSCWFTNVRSCVSGQDWERLRRMITRRADQRCEICGAGEDRATGQYLEAHERWTYDAVTCVQRLRRLICLCSACHLTTHMGYANVTGRADQARAHLGTVTGMSPAAVVRHLDEANSTWIARSAVAWTLDLSVLTGAGITVRRPERAEDRPAAAARGLRAAPATTAVPLERHVPRPSRTDPAPLPPPATRAGQHTGSVHRPAVDPEPAPRRSWLRRLFD